MLQEALESPYILNSIRSSQWENRHYINTLIKLFRLMRKKRLSPAEGQLYFLLRNKYPEAYLELLKEMDPVMHQVCVEEREKLKQQKLADKQEKFLQQQQWVEEERKEYALWQSLKNEMSMKR